MPVYFNGFRTSRHESAYNTVTAKLVQILAEKCLMTLNIEIKNEDDKPTVKCNETQNDAFFIKILKLNKILKHLEHSRSKQAS